MLKQEEKTQIHETIYLKNYQVPPFLISSIRLTFDLNEDHTLVSSEMLFERHPKNQSGPSDLILNGEALILISIKLDNKKLEQTDYFVTEESLIIKNVPNQFKLEIVTKIFPDQNTALSGLYRSSKTYCTQCEAEGFRRITYFLDRPDVLAQYETKIIADKKNYPNLLSNGNRIDFGDLENGKHFAIWHDPFKKPSYLFALVAGDFDLIEGHFITQSNKKVDLQIYVEKGYGDQAHYALFCMKEAMRWDEKTYGREYDLEKYMIVAISDFNMGAMENKGLNIFNTKYILAKPETATDNDYIHILSVIGHEYFHNWSGNRVTCRDWFQLSLKEGLTIFRDQSFTEDLLSQAVMRIKDVTDLRETQFLEDASPLSHPVRPESYMEINNFYTATVYNKGAEVLRMLQTMLGKNIFRKGMDLYFSRYDGQAVTIEDFVQTMEEVSGVDLSQFRLWYSQAGTPIVNVSDDYDSNNQKYTLTISQSFKNQNTQKPMLIPIQISLMSKDGKNILLKDQQEEIILNLKESTQLFQFESIPSLPIPSLLRNFSAPVVLNYAYSDADLLFLMKYDTDAFNRWEAGQKYFLRLAQRSILDAEQNQTLNIPTDFFEAYRHLLNKKIDDPFFMSEMLLMPSEQYIGEQMEIVKVNSIHKIREGLLKEMASNLQQEFEACYKDNNVQKNDNHFDIVAVGKRQLKNRCLAFLMLLPEYEAFGMDQFQKSLRSNMTDTQAALASLVNLDTPNKQTALDEFYQQWKHDALVIDKWFAIQAASKLTNTLEQVKKLSRHEAFDIKNPNKVYALIRTFAHRNLVNFHNKNGEAYAFLREFVQQLDQLNPQVASRMVKPLTIWKRYDKERQTLMKNQLEILLHDKKCSKDIYEIVSKSL